MAERFGGLYLSAMNIQTLATDFAANGFIHIPQLLEADLLQALNQDIDQHFGLVDEEAHEVAAYMQDFACDVIPWDPLTEGRASFQRLAALPALEQLTEACIGQGFQSFNSLVMYSKRGGRGQAWHQDSMPGAHLGFNLNRLCYARTVEQDDGAIVLVPGSHRRGRIPAGPHQESMADELIICPQAGDVLLVHGWCFHRVLPNRSGRSRVSINVRAYPKDVDSSVCATGVYRNGTVYFDQGFAELRS